MGTLRGRDLEMAKQLSEHTRLVDKKGRNQVSFKDMEEQNALYMKDVFTSMVDAHWYYVLIAFFASFFGNFQTSKAGFQTDVLISPYDWLSNSFS